MVSSRIATAIVGLAGSLIVTVALWWYFDSFVFFLFLPFVPFLFRGGNDRPRQPAVRTCPRCEFRTTDEEFEYCPRDGSRLETTR